MALEHALLIALREREQAGLELARRFERSIGFFWHATHQQIYRVLGRMERDGWVSAEVVAQSGRPDKKVYAVTGAGRDALAAWLAEETPIEPLRSELALKMRGASYGDREAVLEVVAANVADHRLRLDHYRELEARDYPDPATLDPHTRDQYLVLRGGIRLEEFWIDWLTDYLEAHRVSTPLDHREPSRDRRGAS
jgi:DNA-binding PadR family transcriptional regulator